MINFRKSDKSLQAKILQTIELDKLTWSLENLNVTECNDGAIIPIIEDPKQWAKMISPAMCYYNNDKRTNSALYNWYAVATKKLAPPHWRIPTHVEWKQVVNYKNPLNLSYSGVRTYGGFELIGVMGMWWSSTICSINDAWCHRILYNTTCTNWTTYIQSCGFSVRCVKDHYD